MSTLIIPSKSQTFPRAYPAGHYHDMLRSVQNVSLTATFDASTAAPDERPLLDSDLATGNPVTPNVATIFWSERLAAPITISGAITFRMYINPAGNAGYTARLRCRLSKITYGGSDIETPIVTADDTVDLAAGQHSFTATPPIAVDCVANERFLLRVSLIPVSGSYGAGAASSGSFSARLNYNQSGAPGPIYTDVTFTENLTFADQGTILFLRRTTSIGIASFMDALPARGVSASTTAVLNTVSGGTEIQWTKTGGGAVAEWISPRFGARGWSLTGLDSVAFNLWLNESATAANAAARLKIFRRRPDGTELQLFTISQSTELATTANAVGASFYGTGFTFSIDNQSPCKEDDRIVIRLYAIPGGGTMASGRTVTLTYDGPTVGASGDSYVTLYDAPDFKLETDPSATNIVTSGQMLGGVGNGS